MDTANKDEALKALSIANKHLNADPPNIATAKKLALKSVALCETNEAMNLLEKIRRMEEELKSANTASNGSNNAASDQANGNAGHSTSSEPFAGSEGMKHRTTHTQDSPSTTTSNTSAKGKGRDDEKRDFTPEQLAIVKRIRKCKVTEYYEILSLQKDCEETDVKKAYRKLALQLHPDKNGAPGADEAFKMVSKAFQVLSDPTLRAAFDRDGGDPESRFGSGMRSSSGMRGPFQANGSFEGEISPEELFNMFFGGGGFGGGGMQFGGSPFGGPVFTASFGPGGFTSTRTRVRRTGTGGTPQAETPQGFKSILIQLLPIIMFLFLAFSNTILDLLSSAVSTPDPSYQFVQSSYHTHARTTGGNLKVEYFVNQQQFSSHPMSTSADGKTEDSRSPQLEKYEQGIEAKWVTLKYNDCVRAKEGVDRQVDNLKGVFGIGADWEKIDKLRKQKISSCEDLKEKGYII